MSRTSAFWDAGAVDLMAGAEELAADLVAHNAAAGVVACGTVGAPAVVRAWGAVSDTSIFEAGSITKTVTGLLLALGIEAGEVSASDRLDRYLPRTGQAGHATLAQLATHTSGLPRIPAQVIVRALVRPRDPYRGITT